MQKFWRRLPHIRDFLDTYRKSMYPRMSTFQTSDPNRGSCRRLASCLAGISWDPRATGHFSLAGATTNSHQGRRTHIRRLSGRIEQSFLPYPGAAPQRHHIRMHSSCPAHSQLTVKLRNVENTNPTHLRGDSETIVNCCRPDGKGENEMRIGEQHGAVRIQSKRSSAGTGSGEAHGGSTSFMKLLRRNLFRQSMEKLQ